MNVQNIIFNRSENLKTKQPIRLIMFTSKSCKFCPEIDRIVRKFVGSGIGTNVNVTTVDVDISPDIAKKYEINRLPAVYMGNERVLEGYMSEDDIRDRLWNQIFHSVLANDLSHEKRKENLIWLTRNMINSVSGKELIRPNIGDYVHIQALQISSMSLLALDPLASHLQYEAGDSRRIHLGRAEKLHTGGELLPPGQDSGG